MSYSFKKSIELAVRKRFNRWFRADRIPVVVTHPDDALKVGDTPRILVLRQDRIGDVLISTPIVRALRKRFPNARIDALLSDNNIAARRAYDPYVDNVLHYKKTVVGIVALRSHMRANAYDIVVDMTDNASSTSSMFVTMSNANYAIGIDKENRGVYTHVVPRVPRDAMHIVDRIVRLLWPFGIDPASVDKHMSYDISDEERTAAMLTLGMKPSVAAEPLRINSSTLEPLGPATPARIRVGVNISGSTLSRRMEASTITAFIGLVQAKHPRVDFFIFTTPDLLEVQRAVCSSTGAHAVPASPSFHDYACALSCMHALVTPDTAAVHLAAAWQMPSVVLYHPEIPAVHPWYPYDSYSIACVTETTSVANISADEISAGIQTMLRETGLVGPS